MELDEKNELIQSMYGNKASTKTHGST